MPASTERLTAIIDDWLSVIEPKIGDASFNQQYFRGQREVLNILRNAMAADAPDSGSFALQSELREHERVACREHGRTR